MSASFSALPRNLDYRKQLDCQASQIRVLRCCTGDNGHPSVETIPRGKIRPPLPCSTDPLRPLPLFPPVPPKELQHHWSPFQPSHYLTNTSSVSFHVQVDCCPSINMILQVNTDHHGVLHMIAALEAPFPNRQTGRDRAPSAATINGPPDKLPYWRSCVCLCTGQPGSLHD